jgi:CrcB protein
MAPTSKVETTEEVAAMSEVRAQAGRGLSGSERPLPIDPDLVPELSGAQRARRTIVTAVAVGGAAGALVRYGVATALPVHPGRFPWSTFIVNVSGSLAVGVLLVLLTERFPRARLARPLLATGFFGAYTTFSTYAVDTDNLLRGHDLWLAVAYLAGSLVAGLAAVVAGVALARAAIHLDRRLDEQLT